MPNNRKNSNDLSRSAQYSRLRRQLQENAESSGASSDEDVNAVSSQFRQTIDSPVASPSNLIGSYCFDTFDQTDPLADSHVSDSDDLNVFSENYFYNQATFNETNVLSDEENDSQTDTECSDEEHRSEFIENPDERAAKISELILEFKHKLNLNKRQTQSMLGLINQIGRLNGVQVDLVPATYHRLESRLTIANLEPKFGLVCEGCSKQVYLNNLNCPHCNFAYPKQNLVRQTNLIFHFNLKTLVKLAIERCELRLPSENQQTETYKYYQSLKPNQLVLTITLNSDGLPLSKASKSQAWPLYIRLNELNCTDELKTFLLATFHGTSKPPANFFLSPLIDDLVSLANDGLFIERLNCQVYVFLFSALFDTIARNHFLMHTAFNGQFGCTICKEEGQVVNVGHGHARIYRPNRNVSLRTLEEHRRHIVDQTFGVRGESILLKLEYFDIFKCVPPDIMHLVFAGLALRLIKQIIKRFLPGKLEIVNQRISLFRGLSEFNRQPRSLELINKFKCNEISQLTIYLSPIIFKGIIPANVFNHFMLLVKCVHAFWTGNLTDAELASLQEYVFRFQEGLSEIYSDSENTMNAHLFGHLAAMVKSVGPAKRNHLFTFEHHNHLYSQLIHSPNATVQQITKRYEENFKLQLEAISKAPHSVRAKTTGRFVNSGTVCFKKVFFQNQRFSTVNSNTKTVDCYVKLINGNAFAIVKYYFVEDRIMCSGLPLQFIGKFTFPSGDDQLELIHINRFRVCQGEEAFAFSEIEQKVLFVYEFESDSADQNQTTGFMIVCDVKHHN